MQYSFIEKHLEKGSAEFKKGESSIAVILEILNLLGGGVNIKFTYDNL